MKAQPTISAPKRLVTQEVKELLARNAEFARLPKRTQTHIANDTISITAYLTQIPQNAAGERLAHQVDFPDFVAGLLQGVFQAIVTYSIDQMKAYAELVKAVSNSLDKFRDQSISDKQARSFLEEQCPECFKLQRTKPLPPKKRPATSRQQLSAT